MGNLARSVALAGAGLPALALVAGLVLSVAAEAQGGGAAPAPAAPAAPGPAQAAWTKLCNTDPASKKELCLVIQELHAPQTGQFIASATTRQITGEPKLFFNVAVPPGMLIQPGVRLQVDNGKQLQVKYGICFPTACYGEIEIDADFIASMKGGNTLLITTLNQQGKGVSFPMTLAGFTKAYDGKGLDSEAAKQRQDELNKALQARAEEARKKLIEQQQKESGLTPPAQ